LVEDAHVCSNEPMSAASFSVDNLDAVDARRLIQGEFCPPVLGLALARMASSGRIAIEAV
jgi:hypothetical protein